MYDILTPVTDAGSSPAVRLFLLTVSILHTDVVQLARTVAGPKKRSLLKMVSVFLLPGSILAFPVTLKFASHKKCPLTKTEGHFCAVFTKFHEEKSPDTKNIILYAYRIQML